MARSPITWRQVSGGNAGNPASAMGTAIQGFGMAGRGALDLNTDLRKAEAIRNAELTQRTIGEVMASGKPLDAQSFNDFAPGVNTGEVMKSVLGARATQSDIGLNDQRASQLEYENSPETRDFQRRQEEARTQSLEEQVNLRRLELNRLQAKDGREAAKYDGITAVQKGYNSEDPSGLRGRAMEQVNNNWETAVREYIGSDRFKDYTPAEKENAIQAWEVDAREQFIQDEMGRMAPEWFSEQQAKYGLTESDLGETTYGRQFQDVQKANTTAIAADFQSELTERKNLQKKAKTDYKNRDLASMIPTGQGYVYNPNAADQKENRLSDTALPKYLEEEMDIELDPQEMKDARELLRSVGGNKAKFTSILEDATERALWRVGPNDDNVDWGTAKTRGAVAKGILEGLLEKEATQDLNPSTAGQRMTFQDIIAQSKNK